MVLSPDDFLVRSDGTYDWSPSRVVSAWKETYDRTLSLLPNYQSLCLLCGLPGSGKSTWLRGHREAGVLYVDATFTTQTSRSPFVLLAASLGKPVDVVLLDTPFDECVRRNALRSPDRQVPYEKVIQMRDALSSDPPIVPEGFRVVEVISSS